MSKVGKIVNRLMPQPVLLENPVVWTTDRENEGGKLREQTGVMPTGMPDGSAGKLRGRRPQQPEPGRFLGEEKG